MRSKIFFTILSLFLLFQILNAQVPQLLNYQGKLITKEGLPASGNFKMTFSIYSTESGGTPLWTETNETVTIFRGVFNVLLNVPNAIFTESSALYLGITVGNEPEMTPRFQLTSVGYAIRAANADNVKDRVITESKIANGAVTQEKLSSNITDNDWTISGSNIYRYSGNVGIGTSNPIEKLDISGSIRASGSINKVDNSSGIKTTIMGTNTSGGGYFHITNPNGTEAVRLSTYSDGRGAVSVKNEAGSTKALVWAHSGGGEVRVITNQGTDAAVLSTTSWGAGVLHVCDKYGNSKAQLYVNNDNRGVLWTGGANSLQAGTEIWYACPEGPEVASYIRGTGKLVNGKGIVTFPDHFSVVANSEGITVNLTPLSEASKGLAVVEKSTRGITVVELHEGNGNYDFDYMVMAVRKGYENYEVIREVNNIQAEIANPAVTIEESIEQRKEK